MLTTKPLNTFLDELASSSPAPGGGSVAALSAALGMALIAMVCRLTIQKKKYTEVQGLMESTLKRSEELRADFTELIVKDTEAFSAVIEAFAMPKETEVEKQVRSAAIQGATKKASLIPLKVMELCSQALPLAKTVAEKGNVNSLSDAGVAAVMLQAACTGAALNVRINLAALEDNSFVEETRRKSGEIQTQIGRLTGEILSFTHARL